MKVIIEKYIVGLTKSIVLFSTDFGIGEAEWMSAPPEITKDYYVEIDIATALEWGTDVRISESQKYSLETLGEVTHIIGLLEDEEEEGLITVRLGNSIFMVNITGKEEILPQGTYLQIITRDLRLFDINF